LTGLRADEKEKDYRHILVTQFHKSQPYHSDQQSYAQRFVQDAVLQAHGRPSIDRIIISGDISHNRKNQYTYNRATHPFITIEKCLVQKHILFQVTKARYIPALLFRSFLIFVLFRNL
jgi:hypothetical protein